MELALKEEELIKTRKILKEVTNEKEELLMKVKSTKYHAVYKIKHLNLKSVFNIIFNFRCIIVLFISKILLKYLYNFILLF